MESVRHAKQSHVEIVPHASKCGCIATSLVYSLESDVLYSLYSLVS